MNALNALTRQQADLEAECIALCPPLRPSPVDRMRVRRERFVGGADPSLLAMDAERVREKKLAFNRSDLL